jgi:antitoxin HigA-1
MVRIPAHRAPTHPGEMLLAELFEPLKMTQVGLAERIGVSVQRVNELVKGKRGMTPDTALRLERIFGMDAQFWLNLQLAWDLYREQHDDEAAQQRSGIKPIPKKELAAAG